MKIISTWSPAILWSHTISLGSPEQSCVSICRMPEQNQSTARLMHELQTSSAGGSPTSVSAGSDIREATCSLGQRFGHCQTASFFRSFTRFLGIWWSHKWRPPVGILPFFCFRTQKEKKRRQQSSVNANHLSLYNDCILVELVWSFFCTYQIIYFFYWCWW